MGWGEKTNPRSRWYKKYVLKDIPETPTPIIPPSVIESTPTLKVSLWKRWLKFIRGGKNAL